MKSTLRIPSDSARLTVKPKMRACRICKTPFEKRSMSHVACSPECARQVAVAAREKAERKELKARKEAIKTRSDHAKEAQQALNSWIVKVRDKDFPCISCGRHHQGQYHGGHYISRGSRPGLALDPRNVHKQCAPCNTHLHGNQALFRIGLIARIGLAEVEALEADCEPRKYDIEELKAIKAYYRAKLREAKKNLPD